MRHGVVLDVHDDLAVVEVFEGTSGIGLDTARVAFSGSPMRIPVGEDWLGARLRRPRRADRRRPADRRRADAPGRRASRSTRRAGRGRPTRSLTGISAIDGLATLVRGQKLPIFSVGGLPHLELAAQVAAQATAGDEPFAVVFAAIGITHADAADVGTALACAHRRRRSGRAAQHRRRPGRRAARHAAHRADDRRAPRVRPRPPRPGRDGRPDELLRGAARGLGGARRDPLAPRLPRPPLQRPRRAARARRADRGPPRLRHPAARADDAGRATSRTPCPTPPATSPRASSCWRPSCTPRACIRRSTRSARCRG